MPQLPKLPSDLVERAIKGARGLLSEGFTPDSANGPPTVHRVSISPAPGRVGKYDKPLADLVSSEPGLTVAEAAVRLGVHPTALYPIIRREARET